MINARPPAGRGASAWRHLVLLLPLALALATGCAAHRSPVAARRPVAPGMRLLAIEYRAHAGQVRSAFVALPRWYRRGSRRALPLVISPHGRGIDARENCVSWGDLPAVGGFAVVCPVGQGRRLRRYSWGAPSQIDDLRRMPEIVSRDVPWLHVDRSRIYAVGGSMGGQETLLLVARAPRLLAGAIAFDAVTNLGAQYRSLPSLRCDRLCYELNGGLARDEAAAAGTDRGRRHADRRPARVRRAKPAPLRPPDRRLGCAGRAVVEHERPDRPASGHRAVGRALRRDPGGQPESTRRGVRGELAALPRRAPRRAPAVRARADGPTAPLLPATVRPSPRTSLHPAQAARPHTDAVAGDRAPRLP